MTSRKEERESPAIGFRVKSGFAVAVALRGPASAPVAVARRIVAMSDPAVPETKQPYHDGFYRTEEDPREIARRLKIVERCAAASVEALLAEEWFEGTRCRAATIVVGSTIEPETVGNPHIRAHAQEGRLFRLVLERALGTSGVKCEVIVQKQLAATTARRVSRSPREIARTIEAFGRALGHPWQSDEKAAAAAAWLALT